MKILHLLHNYKSNISVHYSKQHILLAVCFALCVVFSATVYADENVSISAIVGTTTGGGGGGGGGEVIDTGNATGFTVTAYSYPSAQVSLLIDGQLSDTTVADVNALFTFQKSDMTPGTYTLTLSAIDTYGLRSTLYTFPIIVDDGVTVVISNLIIAPSIRVDFLSVLSGTPVVVYGQSVPGSSMDFSYTPPGGSGPQLAYMTLPSSGKYSYSVDTVGSLGEYSASSKVAFNGFESSWSKFIRFSSALSTVPIENECPLQGDFNNDCLVNLVDFSILAYWYQGVGFPLIVDLNNDNQISIADFSILSYYWTG